MKPMLRISRRQVLGMAAGAAATAALPMRWSAAQEAAIGTAEWKPLFLTADQVRTVGLIAEAIIPRTDTPGALDAHVPEFMDLLLSVDNDRNKTKFAEGLAWMDARSTALHGAAYAVITDEQRLEILKSISDDNKKVEQDVRDGWRFFKDVKRRVIEAYYTSREGLVEELGRPETSMHKPYVGCKHTGEDHSA